MSCSPKTKISLRKYNGSIMTNQFKETVRNETRVSFHKNADGWVINTKEEQGLGEGRGSEEEGGTPGNPGANRRRTEGSGNRPQGNPWGTGRMITEPSGVNYPGVYCTQVACLSCQQIRVVLLNQVAIAPRSLQGCGQEMECQHPFTAVVPHLGWPSTRRSVKEHTFPVKSLPERVSQ